MPAIGELFGNNFPVKVAKGLILSPNATPTTAITVTALRNLMRAKVKAKHLHFAA